VCGGRNFLSGVAVYYALDMLDAERGIDTVIHGGAPGADTLAGKWAEDRSKACRVEFPDWSLGRKAGPIRNQKMLDDYSPEIVVAFPGGRGTADMIRRAKAKGIEVVEPGMPFSQPTERKHD
jgi:hypothetical protein